MGKNVSVTIVNSNGGVVKDVNMKVSRTPIHGRVGEATIWVDKPTEITQKVTISRSTNEEDAWEGTVVSRDKKNIRLKLKELPK